MEALAEKVATMKMQAACDEHNHDDEEDSGDEQGVQAEDDQTVLKHMLYRFGSDSTLEFMRSKYKHTFTFGKYEGTDVDTVLDMSCEAGAKEGKNYIKWVMEQRPKTEGAFADFQEWMREHRPQQLQLILDE